MLRSGYTPCVDGEYCSKGVGIPCPNATYSDHDPETNEEAEGQDACKACPAKTTSPAGSSGAALATLQAAFDVAANHFGTPMLLDAVDLVSSSSSSGGGGGGGGGSGGGDRPALKVGARNSPGAKGKSPDTSPSTPK